MTKKQLKELSSDDLMDLREALKDLLDVMQSCDLEGKQYWDLHNDWQKVLHELESR